MTKQLKLILIIAASVVAATLAIVLPIVLTSSNNNGSSQTTATIEFFNSEGTLFQSKTYEKGTLVAESVGKVGFYFTNDQIIYRYFENSDLSGEPVEFPYELNKDVKLYAEYAKVLTINDFTYEENAYGVPNLYKLVDYTGAPITHRVVYIAGNPDNAYSTVSVLTTTFVTSDFTNLEVAHLSNKVEHFEVGLMQFFAPFAKMDADTTHYINESYDRVLKGYDNSFGIAGSVSYTTFEEMYNAEIGERATDDIMVYWTYR